jgi:hypothetical protein
MGIKRIRKTMNYNITLRSVREALSPWKSNKYYIFVCVCVRAYVHVCVQVPGSVGVCMHLSTCE